MSEPTLQETLVERGKTHGNFTDNAYISQALQEVMANSSNSKWDILNFTQREALQMFAHKIGRILAGNPHEKDHWRDIAGYATLVVDRL